MSFIEIVPWLVWLLIAAALIFVVGYTLGIARLILRRMTFEERLLSLVILWFMVGAAVYAVAAVFRYL